LDVVRQTFGCEGWRSRLTRNRVFTRSRKHRANVEETSSWLKQAYWNPAPGSNVGLGLGS